ncbi:unnamed protein product [Diamesa tonsa]
MKLRTILVVIYILRDVSAREVEIESFQGTADTDPEFVNFGTTRVTKKSRHVFVVSGDFEILKNMGNEYNIRTEILNFENKVIVKQVQPSCEFMKNDKMTWPQLVNKSDMPKDAPCPFPKGKYSIKDYTLDSNQLPPGILPGTYFAKLTILDGLKPVAGYEVKMLIKM